MYCSACGKKIGDDAKFCPECGKAVKKIVRYDVPKMQPQPAGRQKTRRLGIGAIAGIAAGAAAVILLCVWLLGGFEPDTKIKDDSQRQDVSLSAENEKQTGSVSAEEPSPKVKPVETLARPQLVSFSQSTGSAAAAACATYQVASDLSNVINVDRLYLNDEVKALLQKNLFAVCDDYSDEFYEIYEMNRYSLNANFVTVDSLMHTYHLYFSLLLNRTEKNYLSERLQKLSAALLQESMQQYEALAGGEWEEAAKRNAAYFAIAASLQDPSVQIPDYVQTLAEQELAAIYGAGGIDFSELAINFVDYSQFKPRGYYADDETLERYFRAMMWYGQITFIQKEEDLNRSALLMTLAMEKHLDLWRQIYAVTAFFAGSSDDLGYCEYAPAILNAYGAMPAVETLKDSSAFETFEALIAELDPPTVNSVPVWEETEDVQETVKGFRFMGQRFTIDAAVMQQLVFKNVKENAAGEKRLLPDTLDMPAALGSETALQILTEQGETGYEGYSEKMKQVRQWLQESPDELWSASLYSGWLYTLNPLLEKKGAGYPAFMNSEQWSKKNLETYAGSFTELKHDTVLYAKQMMAEMGGGPLDPVDDRGYVEPETEVYRRFAELAAETAEGLNALGMIGGEDLENLSRLAELAERLKTISEKELRDELPTDEEFELIRSFGGTLEHFWKEAVKEKAESEWFDSQEIPSSLVTDLATDPNGRVLEIANGRPSRIYVIVNVDGTLRIASGAVYDFYQFEQPINERMTDKEWRQEIGQWMLDEGGYNRDCRVEKPWWTESYRYHYQW